MKIIDAFWEKRNLGMDVIEASLSSDDMNNFSDIIKELYKISNDKYCVLKMPVGNLNAMHNLQDIGFYFMESLYTLGIRITNYKCPLKFAEINNKISYKIINKNNKNNISNIIEHIDGLYTTDRIYLDPKLDNKVSTKRYQNWIKDLSNSNNSIFYEVISKLETTPIGYGICTVNNETKEIHSLLTGIYKPYHGKGYGAAVIHCPIIIGKDLGYTEYTTSISSNNIKVLKKHLPYGLNLIDEKYVLRKMPNKLLE